MNLPFSVVFRRFIVPPHPYLLPSSLGLVNTFNARIQPNVCFRWIVHKLMSKHKWNCWTHQNATHWLWCVFHSDDIHVLNDLRFRYDLALFSNVMLIKFFALAYIAQQWPGVELMLLTAHIRIYLILAINVFRWTAHEICTLIGLCAFNWKSTWHSIEQWANLPLIYFHWYSIYHHKWPLMCDMLSRFARFKIDFSRNKLNSSNWNAHLWLVTIAILICNLKHMRFSSVFFCAAKGVRLFFASSTLKFHFHNNKMRANCFALIANQITSPK